MRKRKASKALTIGVVALAVAAAAPRTLPVLPLASAEAAVSKSRAEGAGGGGNISGAGDRLGNLLSGWAVPVLTVLAGCLLVGALASRNVGTSVGIVVITLLGLIFLLCTAVGRAVREGHREHGFLSVEMAAQSPRKVVRSYRLVFRRRWRIFRIQNWRIPLPGGLELRLLGYWLACLALIAILARLPLAGRRDLGDAGLAAPAGAADRRRLGALALGGRWPPAAPSAGRVLRLVASASGALPRCAAARRRGQSWRRSASSPRAPISPALDYPRGRIAGPARILLRYPVRLRRARAAGPPRRASQGLAAAQRWRLRPIAAPPLHRGKTLEVPAGRMVLFEAEERGGESSRTIFFWANLVLRTPSEAWAVYQLEGHSYPGPL